MKHRSAFRRILREDMSSVTGDDLMGEREPEAGAGSLRGEERLEHMFDRVRRNAGAGVAHGDVRERRRRLRESESFESSAARAGSIDPDRASIGHRIPGVDGEIQQHLMHLTGVDRESDRHAGRRVLQNRAFTCHRDELRKNPGDPAIEIDILQLELGGLRESEDLMGNPLPAIHRLRDVFCGRLSPRIVTREPHEHVGEGLDTHQDIVEFVSHGGADSSDRTQPVRDLELLLECLSVGRVVETDDEPAHGLSIDNGSCGAFHGEGSAASIVKDALDHRG